MKVLSRLLLLAMLVASLGLAGCDDGDNGDPGAAGASAYEIAVANGFTGTEAEWLASLQGADAPVATAAPLESCNVCHGSGSAFAADANHDVSDQLKVSFTVASVTPSATPAGATIVANVKVAGVNRNDFTNFVAAAAYAASTTTPGQFVYAGSVTGGTQGGQIVAENVTVASTGSGNYSIFVPAPLGWVWDTTTPVSYFVRLNTGPGITYPEANIVASQNAATLTTVIRDVVSNDACIACHANNIFNAEHPSRIYHNSTYGVGSCVICHKQASRDNLTRYAHGIHNAHNMPSGQYNRTATSIYHTTYPTYMENCSVCHAKPAQLTAVNSEAVSGPFCFSCHESMASWTFESGLSFHEAYTATTDCSVCHTTGTGGVARATVAEFHNGLITERGGLIWNGQDVSVVEGAKVDMQITGITSDGVNVSATWTATYDADGPGGAAPVAVNPCNAVAAANAPAFFAAAANTTTGQVNGNLSFLKGFGQGDDWVNDGAASSPGQAAAVSLTTTNTTCAGNVATTTFALTAAEQASSKNGRGVLALQGKAQVVAPNSKVVQVRSKTPTREYVVATGALPAETRRPIIDSAACLKCHVGSMYQHGGNRVDNIEMCVICHNEASSEQNVRESMGVDATEAYDGQAGQTYGFKSFLHAVHSAGETGKITALYRENQGIFVWAADEADIPNWPGTGDQFVYGSSRPTGTGPNGEISKPHTFHAPTYPRLLNDCAACHVSSFADLPNQSISVATTINTGTSYNGQLDDVLEGTAAATCMSCHQSGDAGVQASLKGHAYQNGWYPRVFTEGRKTILEAK